VVVLRNRSMLPSQCRTLDELSSQLSKGLVRAISLSVGSGWRVAAFCSFIHSLLLKPPRENYNLRGIYIPFRRTHSGFGAGTSGPAAPLGAGNAA